MNVVVNDLLTNYQKEGKGPAVVLLHGWGDNMTTYKTLAARLAKKYTVITVDLPGFGGTQMPPQTWGLQDYSEFVAEFLEKIGAGKVRAVVGHSNGGSIAIKGLALGNLQAQKLVLLASAGIRDVYKGRKKALRLAAKAAKAATAPLPKRLQARIKKRAYKAIGSDMFVAEHLQETYKRVVNDDVQADAAKLKLPTLLIYGSADTATPPSFGQLYHVAIVGSRLELLDGAGHFVHHDQPEQVGELVQEFLA